MSKISIKLMSKEKRILMKEREVGGLSKRKSDRINILLWSDAGRDAQTIAELLHVHVNTVTNVRKNYLKRGASGALEELKRPGQPIRYTTDHEANIVALACTTPPEGSARWTLELLTEQARNKVTACEKISKSRVRLVLKKMNVSLGRSVCGVLEQ